MRSETKMPSANDVGPGWKPYVEPLIAEVERFGGKVHQIKEKFGGLRFYYELPKETPEEDKTAFDDLVQVAEALCNCACEECGRPGSKTNSNWIKTLCEDHDKERQQIQKELDNEYAKRHGKGQESNI